MTAPASGPPGAESVGVPTSTGHGNVIRSTRIEERPHLVHENPSEYLMVSEDRVENAIRRHRERLRDRSAWVTPATLLVAIILALSTADFRPLLGIDGPVWHAVFLLGAALSVFWTVRGIVRALQIGREDPTEAIIRDLRGQSQHFSLPDH